ncbi:fido domain-containing protein [Hypoxylon cercidicola]|nr:fido domain-containing protein [Hypoxylon cercidicola]
MEPLPASVSPSKPVKGKRQSLTNIFPQLQIHSHTNTSSVSSTPSSPKKPMTKLRSSMTRGWPNWLSIRRTSREPIDLTIRMSQYLRDEANASHFPEDPATILQTVKDKSAKLGKETAELWAKIEDSLVELVYGSNFIEVTGSDFDVTEKLCRQILRGENVSAEVEPRSAEYEQARAALIALKRPSSFEEVIRSRQEIINHSQALNYAIDHFVLDSKPITEDFLKELHAKLCFGNVLHEEAGEPGKYRTWEIAARHGKDMKQKSIFIRASAVPQYMADLVDDLHKDIIDAEQTKVIDPFDIASRYCHRLVCIHPFGDGNGRMCRILLNILLLKYAGYVTTFGGTEGERQEYLDIARRSNKRFHQEDMEVLEAEKKGHRELAKFTLRKSKAKFESLWAWASHLKDA